MVLVCAIFREVKSLEVTSRRSEKKLWHTLQKFLKRSILSLTCLGGKQTFHHFSSRDHHKNT